MVTKHISFRTEPETGILRYWFIIVIHLLYCISEGNIVLFTGTSYVTEWTFTYKACDKLIKMMHLLLNLGHN